MISINIGADKEQVKPRDYIYNENSKRLLLIVEGVEKVDPLSDNKDERSVFFLVDIGTGLQSSIKYYDLKTMILSEMDRGRIIKAENLEIKNK